MDIAEASRLACTNLDNRTRCVDAEVGDVDKTTALHDLLQLSRLRLVARHAPDLLLERAFFVDFEQ